MKLRSMLFVPADSDRKLSKAITSSADALILDLEDSVASSRKVDARTGAAKFITMNASSLKTKLFVRINPLDSGMAMDDLAAVVVPGLAGIMLPKTKSAADITRLACCLDALEAKANIAAGSILIVPVATETAEAMLNMQSYAGVIPRLAAITWGAEDLSAAIGAISNREESGDLSPLYQLANSMCLCAATSTGVLAIDTLYADFKDDAGLATSCSISRRRGFRGRIAIHPGQVETINRVFSPSDAELTHARRIVEAFSAQPDVGTLSLDGVMLDKPHLTQALRTLSQVND